jgi:hypothetical protein
MKDSGQNDRGAKPIVYQICVRLGETEAMLPPPAYDVLAAMDIAASAS